MASLLTCLLLIATVQVFSTEAQCPSNLIATSKPKTVLSPNYPERYPRNQNCSILITSNGTQKVHISTIDMDLFGDKDNCGDNVKVYDGSNAKATLLKTVCGKEMVTVQSTGENLYIMFTSDAVRESKGFALKYWSATSYSPVCGSNGAKNIDVGSTPVFLHLPHMNGQSPQNCSYTLNAGNGNMVYVELPGWDKPNLLNSITVYNGMSTTTGEMVSSRGMDRPFWSVGSQGQYLTIKVEAAASVPADAKGFYVKAMSMAKNQTNCIDVSSMPIGPTPSYFWYPIFHMSGTICQKTLLAPGTSVKLSVHGKVDGTDSTCNNLPFTTDPTRPCEDTTLIITSTDQNLLLRGTDTAAPVLLKATSFEKYCNGGPPMEMMANNRSMEEMHIEHIQKNSNCMRRIKANSADDVVYLMLDSSLMMEDYCVYVYDGMDATATMIWNSCKTFKETVHSSGQYLTFHVKAGDNTDSGKIEAKYFSVRKDVNCPPEMNLLAKREKQILSTPNFPMEYPLNALCKWRFVSYRPDFVVVVEVLESNLPEDCSDVAYFNDGELHRDEKLGEWCGIRKPVYRGTGQTLLLTFDADYMGRFEGEGNKGFRFQYYADYKEAREMKPGTDVLTIAGVLTVIVVAGGLIFIVYRLCTRGKEKKKQREADRNPIITE